MNRESSDPNDIEPIDPQSEEEQAEQQAEAQSEAV